MASNNLLQEKDLCRLCAKNDLVKDLMHDDNKFLLKLIQDFVQISIKPNDPLPSKICLVCEEKMLSIHTFIVQCNKVQTMLKELFMVVPDMDVPVKTENGADTNLTVKAEVDLDIVANNELSAEDFVNAIADNEDMNYYDSGAEEYDEKNVLEDMSIDNLKRKKTKKDKCKEDELVTINQFNDVKVNGMKVKDFVCMKCHVCGEETRNWKQLYHHCTKTHKTKPVVYCLCSFEIRSKTVLYTHVSNHKMDEKVDTDSKESIKSMNIKTSDLVNFNCIKCAKKFYNFHFLKRHSERVHNCPPLVRCACGALLKSKSVMYKHISDHKNPNIYCCDKCPTITKSLSAFEKHKLRHVPKQQREFKCSTCEKVFHTKETLKSHMKSHIPIEERKLYECDLCHTKFTSSSSVVAHKKVVHHKVKSYVCDLCGYACATNGELKQHRAIHSDEKPFECNKCSKRFKTYANLKTHEDIHEDTSYACYVCNRILNSRRTLRKHLLVHQNECRHICSYCNKAFKRRQTLKVHLSVHTGDKPLSCKWCDERFSYASTLRSHRLRYHPDKMVGQGQVNNYQSYSQTDEDVANLENDMNSMISKMNTTAEAIP